MTKPNLHRLFSLLLLLGLALQLSGIARLEHWQSSKHQNGPSLTLLAKEQQNAANPSTEKEQPFLRWKGEVRKQALAVMGVAALVFLGLFFRMPWLGVVLLVLHLPQLPQALLASGYSILEVDDLFPGLNLLTLLAATLCLLGATGLFWVSLPSLTLWLDKGPLIPKKMGRWPRWLLRLLMFFCLDYLLFRLLVDVTWALNLEEASQTTLLLDDLDWRLQGYLVAALLLWFLGKGRLRGLLLFLPCLFPLAKQIATKPPAFPSELTSGLYLLALIGLILGFFLLLIAYSYYLYLTLYQWGQENKKNKLLPPS